AAARYRRALAVDPAHAAARNNFGDALVAAGDLAGAESLYRDVLAAAADDARAHNNLGLVLMLRDDLSGAGRHLRAAVALGPGYGHAHYNLALLNDRMRDSTAAAVAYRRALACGNAPARAAYGLAVIEQTRGRADLAIPLYAHTLAHDPSDLDSRANLAIALQEEGRLDEALAEAEALLARSPDHPSGVYVRGWVRLLRGDLAGGYDGYGVRWRRPDPDLRQHHFPTPLWNGEPLGEGQRLLLWGEFGVGDELIMAGLLGDVLARGTAVVLECDPRFVPLFRRSWPAVTVVARADPPDERTRAPDVAAQSSLMRLPMLVRRGVEDFPRHGGYLRPDPERVRAHRAAFAALGPGAKVGLAWTSGNPRTGGRKSIRLEQWAPVLAVPGVHFVSLQYADADEDIARARARGVANLTANPNPRLRDDLEDLAAQVAALDAVVTIAGINAHMAGALGRPGLVLMPRTPLWFWFDRGEESPWYPSLRLVRQTRDGDWAGPIARLAGLLAERVG
ncbi:MAG TPA: tetratricopeptide repeat-containing glycosyltransferase family protein, partial [Azospirillum sp.]